MRTVIAAVFSLVAVAVSATTPAQADPYPWCAHYAGFGGGGVESCYYMTLEQCRASISGLGGFCNRSVWYDGKPVTTDQPQQRSRRRG